MRYDQLYQLPPAPTPWWRRLGTLLLSLLLLAGVVSGALLLWLRPYMVYTREGVRLDLPRQTAPQEEEVSAFALESPDDEDHGPLHALLLPVEALDEGTIPDQVEAAGCNGVVLTMKEADGSLQYLSQLPQAKETGASLGDPARNAAIRALTRREDLHTVALVTGFRDDKTARAYPHLALRRASGSPWRDEEGVAWLDPRQEDATAYLTGICQELAHLGFDEILLVDGAFPTQGDLDQVAGLGALRQTQEAVAAFYRTLTAGLEESGSLLGILADPALFHETPPPSGQTLESLAVVPRIWGYDADSALRSAFAQDGQTTAREKVIDIRTNSGKSWLSWAIF